MKQHSCMFHALVCIVMDVICSHYGLLPYNVYNSYF
jgi:hypothetical protein